MVPCLLYLGIAAGGGGPVDFSGWRRLALILWPTFQFIMAAEGGAPYALPGAFLISALCNALLYALLGTLISIIYQKLH